MANCKEKLFTEFPPVSTEEWMNKVTADLKGADFQRKLVWRTNEGFDVQPMYRAEDLAGLSTLNSLPGEFPYTRGTSCTNKWLVRQDVYAATIDACHAQAVDLLSKGITSLGFSLEKDQITPQAIATLLTGISPVEVELNFYTCVKESAKLIALLTQYFESQNYDLAQAKGSVMVDAYSRLLKRGKELDNMIDYYADAITAAAKLPRFRVVAVNSLILNNAGAYITQELGFALAWGNDLIARLLDKGIAIDEIASRIKFNMGISSNYFMEMAKFRAARMLWAQIVAAYKPTHACAAKMKIHAETSQFNMTVYDAHVNLLRSQTEAMSATLAGVDSLYIVPFDKAFTTPNDFSNRIARNQQLMLKEECHFDKVVDAAAGSYYVENLTQSIANEAWKLFLEIEDKGGFLQTILSNEVQERIEKSSQARKAALSSRKEILLGTNQYPNSNEKVADKITLTPTTCACECKSEGAIKTLSFDRGATQFEALRLATEKAANRPKVFMLTIGNPSMRLARSQFSGNFFGCAGYEIIDNLGFETVDEGVAAAIAAKADIVVVCSSDDEYAAFVPEVKQKLNGAAILVVAGAPACTEELKAQGIEHFIHVRCNVLDTLKAFNAQLLK